MPHEMKRTVKDSVFTYLFKQPEYTLQLYKTLHPEDTDVTEADCKIITTENIMVNGMYNDLGILIRSTLILLIEAQSTFTLNIALRLLLYLAVAYKDYVDESNLDIYGNQPIHIPRPELYVVYTGSQKNVPETICLSDLFYEYESGTPANLELSARILRYEHTNNIIDQYIRFCQICDEQRKKHGYTQKAVKETIRICLEEGILAPFLTERQKEVLDIMSLLFDHDRIMEIHDHRIMMESMEKGMQKGIQKGRMEERSNMVQLLMDRFHLSREEAQAAVEENATKT